MPQLDAVPPQQSLSDHVAQRIASAIISGVLRSGERLIETRLAEQLGVSRGPVREALRRLEAEGLVRTAKGRGASVIRPSVDEVEQMVVMRALLEGLAARLVAARGERTDLESLGALHERIGAAARSGDLAVWRDLDWSFHEQLCSASGNRMLLDSWRAMRDLVRIYLHQSRSFETDLGGILRHHDAFIGVLRGGDPDEAENVFRSILIQTGYRSLGRPVPAELAGYLTRTVTTAGAIVTARRGRAGMR